ncbi:MAG TPA: single-stranded DNA-binding protein [Candidatus Saccharimonadales bacterium]|nr:single-stranded DNA-binding protein [Candidatus Saccharimonadales bacterium]
MAKSFNQAIVMGNLTRDPELRTTPSGQSVASFAVATNRSWVDGSGERKEAVEYHEIVAWGKLGELANQYLSKGRKVMVVGRLQTQSWEKDGVKRQRTEIVASDINFLDRPGEGGGDYTPNTESVSSDKAATESKPAKPKKDVVIEDLGDDEPVNLDEIPF